MCGICGLIDYKLEPASAERASDMTAVISHRGPDHRSVWSNGPAHLGHTRLSVIDVSDLGNQPMVSSDGRFVICYNGEVYNFAELRQELEQMGVRFRSRSDTEVLLEAFSRWGVASLRRFNGIFAFAIWDRREECLFLVRDRFGVKPLYYDASDPMRISFGSEIKAVLRGHSAPGAMDWAAMHEFMHYGAGGLGTRTLFSRVRKLESGHVLRFDRAGTQITAYWSQEVAPPNPASPTEAVSRVRDLLEAAVRRQLVSDVPLGIFLSGGVDSSAIAAFAARHHAGRLQSYAVGFDFAGDGNELPKAAAVARHLGLAHHELFIRGIDLPDVITAQVQHHDLPFSDAANLPLYLLCREIRREVTVVLQGDGGDEVFGGYRRYALLERHRTLAAVAPLARLLPLGRLRRRRLQRMARIWGERDATRQMALLLAQDYPVPSPLRGLGAAFRERAAQADPFQRYREVGRRYAGLDRVQQMLWVDMQILMPDIFLEKVDRATMAWGVEARVPFLDYDLTDYVLPLPAKIKLPRGQRKALLKAALRGVVPDFVLDAPKMGFDVPYSRWLAGPLATFARDRICGGAAASAGLIDPRVAAELLAAHSARSDDHGFLLWKLLNLALWYEHYRPHLHLGS